jgi:hypothetical protein
MVFHSMFHDSVHLPQREFFSFFCAFIETAAQANDAVFNNVGINSKCNTKCNINRSAA